VDSKPRFERKLKGIREEKGRFFERKSLAGCGRMGGEKLGLFPENLA
jgi:hypothetical protein